MTDHFGAEALFENVNVQCKAVFSYAMTMMDKIDGWEDEEKRVGSKLGACMFYTTKALTKEQTTNPAMEEDLKKRMLSIMLCTSVRNYIFLKSGRNFGDAKGLRA